MWPTDRQFKTCAQSQNIAWMHLIYQGPASAMIANQSRLMDDIDPI